MTAILNDQGHLVLPPEINREVQAHSTLRFDVMVSTTGVIMLRPERRPRRTLVESFAALRGLEIEHRRDPIPEPPAL
jgi:hypothetical protein